MIQNRERFAALRTDHAARHSWVGRAGERSGDGLGFLLPGDQEDDAAAAPKRGWRQRHALDEGPSRAVRAKLIMTMAEVCAVDGRPDSALVYTAWASQGFGNEVKGRAMILTAQVWEPVNQDSAIAAYSRYIDAFHNSEQSVMPARFRRAELLEQRGRWFSFEGHVRIGNGKNAA